MAGSALATLREGARKLCGISLLQKHKEGEVGLCLISHFFFFFFPNFIWLACSLLNFSSHRAGFTTCLKIKLYFRPYMQVTLDKK